jgi:hypothetical protein
MSTDDEAEAGAEAPAAKKPKKAKAAKEPKAKKTKGKGAAAASGKALAISIPAHPRAQRSIRRIRARTALAAFVLVLFLSHRSGVPGQEAVMRALLAGLIGNLAGWGCALAVWRQLVLAEVRLVETARRERRRAQAEAAAEHAAARAAAAAS